MNKQFPIKKINLKKVDIGNDFRDFPPIFSNVKDIQDFIEYKKLKLPVLTEILRLRAENKLDLTPTESEFYFHELFDYIYDVYRIPVEETYTSTCHWLDYIENSLIHGGIESIIKLTYEFVSQRIDSHKFMRGIFKNRKNRKLINHYTDIGDIKQKNKYYNKPQPNVIESFWIKSSRMAGQPVIVENEAYMRVHVYPDRVYIFGCDDSSYTFTAKSLDEAKEFAMILKTQAPVWNFGFTKCFGKQFEFTN